MTCFGDAQNSQFLQVSCTFDHVFPEQPRVGLLVMDDRWTPAAGDFRNVSSVKNLHSSSHSASAEQKKAIWRHLPSLKLTAKAPKSGFFGIWSFPMGFSSLCSGRIDNCSDDEKNILYIFTCIYIYIFTTATRFLKTINDKKMWSSNKTDVLVGGFNPIEKYWSKWESSPNRGEDKKIFKTTTQCSGGSFCCSFRREGFFCCLPKGHAVLRSPAGHPGRGWHVAVAATGKPIVQRTSRAFFIGFFWEHQNYEKTRVLSGKDGFKRHWISLFL